MANSVRRNAHLSSDEGHLCSGSEALSCARQSDRERTSLLIYGRETTRAGAYTFAPGRSATATDGRKSVTSRRATPIWSRLDLYNGAAILVSKADSSSGYLLRAGIVPKPVCSNDRIRLLRSPAVALVGASPVVSLKNWIDYGPGCLNRILTGK